MQKHILDAEWLTTRDVLLLPNASRIRSRSHVEMAPFLYSAPMDTVTGYHVTKAMLNIGEIPVVSRFIPQEEREKTLVDFGSEHVFFAVGLEEALEFAEQAEKILPRSHVNLTLDIAHGDMEQAHLTTKKLRSLNNVRYIMSGSICTATAAKHAVRHGCTHLRVGVGPGAACTTRLMTGVGAPNLSAVYRIAKEFHNTESPWIIADGGITHPGDVAKYLAAGAHGVMMGSIFSKCIESPGWEEQAPNELYKSYRGQASAAFQKSIYGKANHCPEGASSQPFRWSGDTVESIVQQYRGGLRSTCSYLGLYSINDLAPPNVKFIKITPAGYQEGTPHGV